MGIIAAPSFKDNISHDLLMNWAPYIDDETLKSVFVTPSK
jgi:hypothetical protein